MTKFEIEEKIVSMLKTVEVMKRRAFLCIFN